MTLRAGKIYVKPTALLPFVLLPLFNPPEYIGAMLFCAFLHESGHLIAVKAVGAEVVRIDVMLFGAQIKTGGRLCTYAEDALVYVSGAAANFVGAVCAYFAYLFYPTSEIMFLLFANLFYAFFNMLPIRGLDGGGFLEALLLRKYEPETVWKITEKTTFLFIAVMFCLSVWLIYVSGTNFSMLFVALYLFMNL